MTERKTWSGAPWEPGERCGTCGCRIDEASLCQCVDVLYEEIARLRARIATLEAPPVVVVEIGPQEYIPDDDHSDEYSYTKHASDGKEGGE